METKRSKYFAIILGTVVILNNLALSAHAQQDTEEPSKEEHREDYTENMDTEDREELISEKETLVEKWTTYRGYLTEYQQKIDEGDEYSHFYAIRIQVLDHLINRLLNTLTDYEN